MNQFNRERFLFWMLAGIFIFEGLLFTAGFVACWRGGGLQACPQLGDRYEATFSVMVATTLALLTGGAVVSTAMGKGKEDSPAPKPIRPAKAEQPPMVPKPDKPDIGVKGLR